MLFIKDKIKWLSIGEQIMPRSVIVEVLNVKNARQRLT